ncbi:PREDICTED: cytochrome c oxidase subunit 7B, mitochondrial [Gavialis gangeticus]|uniref:cytochrome c oxidase subunit 7B, mitochondrial n=1 Tax=Gavialis gangeticus TaxID=94835 RepID=UPI00092F0F99|nr:PREDICTED: cytochrome c oxidase subunit 7B, mitochondrial [Gavialis gangeticus]
MLPWVRAALGRTARDIRRISARQVHQKHEPDFHDKHGNMVLISGTVFCLAVWTYVATLTGIEWNVSPVGRVTPKEWRED